ncbi:hypothetical protein [Nocardia tengchongensis]|uniref:hypothetical protein n=1 Tax=Nocardia tengchongensis TaxID=2055889 RepID=UPI00364C4D40
MLIVVVRNVVQDPEDLDEKEHFNSVTQRQCLDLMQYGRDLLRRSIIGREPLAGNLKCQLTALRSWPFIRFE